MKGKCNDFDISCQNSDAECFNWDAPQWDNKLAENAIKDNPKICDICVYNPKHKHHNYKSWQEYRKDIGVPPK